MKAAGHSVIPKRLLLWVGLGIWLAGVCAAFALVWRYKLTAGPLAHAPERWPATSVLRRDPDLADVVFIAHPRCACTSASMTELVRLADEVRGIARIHVVIVRPRGAEPGFEDGAILTRARTIAGAEVVVDVGGKEAELFGAIVSGSTIAYDKTGVLVFRGGLTIARGHEGRGPAHDQILSALRGGSARDTSPTYGCALAEEAR